VTARIEHRYTVALPGIRDRVNTIVAQGLEELERTTALADSGVPGSPGPTAVLAAEGRVEVTSTEAAA
ncbi:MAG: hypothetical protein Q4G45_00225, partial [Actinomycetia bacterium]|nr:hypothetical protein [Actinomycetes bacterium]